MFGNKDEECDMNEKTITQELIVALMFYGIIKEWDISKLLKKYEDLGIPRNIVDDCLNGCGDLMDI